MCENCLYRKRHYLYKGYPVVYLKLPHQYCLNDRDSSVAIQKLVVVSLFLLFLVDHYANLYEFLQLNIPLISYLSLQLSLYVSLYYWATNLETHRDKKGKQYLSSRRNNVTTSVYSYLNFLSVKNHTMLSRFVCRQLIVCTQKVVLLKKWTFAFVKFVTIC